MVIPRFYCSDADLLIQGGQLPLALAHHAVRVLRLGVGATLVLFDGSGGEYRTQLTHVEREKAMIAPGTFSPVERESPLKTCLIQGLCATDKMDWVIQKAVELGVHSILVTAFERSVVQLSGDRAQRRLDHWSQVMISAAEQCGRNRLPDLRFCRQLDELVSYWPEGSRLMLDPEGEQDFCSPWRPNQGVTLLVGPEGGVTDAEQAWARRQGFVTVRAGPRILRTETAGLAVLAALQFGHGDWHRDSLQGDKITGVMT